MTDLYPHSQIADRTRGSVTQALTRASAAEFSLRELCYDFPSDRGVALSITANHTVGRAEIRRGYGRDPLVKYCLAMLYTGMEFEASITRDEPAVVRMAVDGRFIGRCEPVPKRQTRMSKPGLLNFYLGLPRFISIWWAHQYDLWLGDQPFGSVLRPGAVSGDTIKIKHVSGRVLPVNMLSYRSWIRGNSGSNYIIPQNAPMLDSREEEQFYFAASLMFKMVIFEYDLSD